MGQSEAAAGGAQPPQPPSRRYLDGCYTPARGAYVVFTLDAAATLDGLDDPVAIAQASALPKKQYVGTLIQDIGWAMPYQTCYISLLSQGPPLPIASEGLDEDMCVPLAPATHRKGRSAISPSPRLPWDNLYHHTTILEIVRLPSRKENYSKSHLLPLLNVRILTMAFNDDGFRSDAMEREFKANNSDTQVYSREPFTAGDSHSQIAVHSEGGPEYKDDDDDPLLPVLEYSTHMSGVDTFRSARQLREDIAELKRIRMESEQRRQQHDAAVSSEHIREGTVAGGKDMDELSVHDFPQSSAPVGSPFTGANTHTSSREASVSGQERIKIERVPSSIFQGFVATLKARLISTRVKSLRIWRSAGLSKDSATGHSPAQSHAHM
ncbi:hypothetical protein FA95DRAFT_1682770 [Auriscalpium vulgare]|uniref:Uncharacterized protein n=1 Tax=Auriscalpium vulgare TaxID=40419 RepID=A0ACB8REM5_9AGAM|nr:hypothetical protein FA95DRAFT_1682770 [Auriscalpium vulgare]